MAQERGAGGRRAVAVGPSGPASDAGGRAATGPTRGVATRRAQPRRLPGQQTPDGLTREERTEAQARYDGPPIPEEITGKELDRSVLAQLRSLPEKLGQRVARHLAAAGAIMDEDPKTAYQHTLAARARASRLAVVREAVGEAAYAVG